MAHPDTLSDVRKIRNGKAVNSDANFVLVKTPDSKKVLEKMRENKILIRDRSAFENLENCVRITIGSKKQIIRVLDVMTN